MDRVEVPSPVSSFGRMPTAGNEEAAAPDPDIAILERVASGDGDAFAILVEKHQQRLFHLCERMLGQGEEARDAVQDVLLKIYRKAASYKPRGQVYTWMYRIAVNHCLNRLRRRKIVRFLSFAEAGSTTSEDEELELEPLDETPDAVARLTTRQRWQQTRTLIDQLPPGQRTALILAKFEGLSYREIAEVMEISESAVESRLFRAMRRLTQEMAE